MSRWLVSAFLALSAAVWAVPMPVQESTFVWRCVGPNGVEIAATSQGDAFLRCAEAAEQTPGTDWFPDFGTFRFHVEPDAPPPAVDCAGIWSAWTRVPGSEGPCSGGFRSVDETRHFTVTTSPSNGGAACPASPQSRAATEPCGGALPATFAPVLSVAPNGRHLRLDGEPWFWIGDTGWTMGHRLDAAGVTAYLEDRRARGVRVIQGPIITQAGTAAPYDGGPDDPFILTATTVALNEPFFSVIDHAVAEAGRLGIALWMAPMWGPHNDRHIKDLDLYKQYFALVASRYKTQAHVNFMIGEYDKLRWSGPNDDVWEPQRPMNAEEMTRLRAAVSAMRANAHPSALIAMHGDAGKNVAEDWEGEQDVDLYLHQAYQNLTNLVVSNGWYSGVSRPFLQSEINYEGPDLSLPEWNVRVAAWLSALGGGAGFTYGNSLVWQFADGWQGALDAGGGVAVFSVLRPFMDRIHDEGNVADAGLVVDFGHQNNPPGRVGVLRRGDRTAAWFYVGNGRNFEVRTDQFAGSGPLRGRWMRPEDGSVLAEFDVVRGAAVEFDPPGAAAWTNDWVLELWVPSGTGSGTGELALEFWPPTENEDGTPVSPPLGYIIDRSLNGGPLISKSADQVVDAPAGRKRASIFGVPVGLYSAQVRAVDALGEVSFPSESTTVAVSGDQQGTPMGILDVTVYSSSANKNPGGRALEADFGDLDWAHFGRSAAADFESKVGGSVLQDYVDIGSPTVIREVGGVGTAPAVSWTNGTPTATQAATTAHISNSVNSAGFRLDSAALDPNRIYRFVFLVGVDAASADIDISLSEGSASSFSTTITSGAGTVAYEVSVVVRVDSATEFLRFDFTKVSGTNHRLHGVYVQDFGFELELYDTFTDTNGTGIESHTPDFALQSAGVYEAVGATSVSSDVTGSGGMSIQSNQLELTTSAQRARWRTGHKDHVVELSWVTSATTGHRIGVSPRHLNKANQYWFNLREPNDDYSFYREDADTPGQTNLTGTAQAQTFNTNATYHVRASVIDLIMRLEVDGELIRQQTLSSDDIPGANGVAFGVEGVATNNHFDFVKVWSPARGLLDLGATGGVTFGGEAVTPLTVGHPGESAVGFGVEVMTGSQLGEVSLAGEGTAAFDRAGGVQAVDVSGAAEGAQASTAVLTADVDVLGGVDAGLQPSALRSGSVSTTEAADASAANSATADQQGSVGGDADAGVAPGADLGIPVDLSGPATGDHTTQASAIHLGVLGLAGDAGHQSAATLQGEITVDVASGAVAGAQMGAVMRLPLTIALNAQSGSAQVAIANFLGGVGGDADAGVGVDRTLGTLVDVSLLSAAEAAEAIAATSVHLTSINAQAGSTLALQALLEAGVEVNEAGEATFAVSGVLDTERIIISGEIRIIDETALIRVRRIDRGGLV